jgi:dipeptidyl aminopeptidase/acylaminoacyl peptidase
VINLSAPLFVAALLCSLQAASAEEAKPQTLPKVTVVPEVDFAKHGMLGAPNISPDGQHIAVSVHLTENGESRYQLAVLHLPDLKFVSRLDMAAHNLPLDIIWVDNKRLVMGVGEEVGQFEAPVGTGDIISVDFDGKNKHVLFSDSKRSSTAAMTNMLKIPKGFGSINGTPDQPNGHFYLTVIVYPDLIPERSGSDESQSHETQIYDIDTGTGFAKVIGEIGRGNYEFVVHDGVARYAYGGDTDLKDHVFYRAGAEQEWTELAQSAIGKHFVPYLISADGKNLYSMGNPTGGPNEFAISNLDGSERKVLASNPRVSISSVMWSPPPATPFAAVAGEGKPVFTYLDDSKYAKALKALNGKFPDHVVTPADISNDGMTMLIRAASDRDFGTYALFDMKTNNLQPLYQVKPEIKPEQLGERRPFWFKASSGAELGGYITLPPGRGEKNLPTLLIAHGGPLGINDPWTLGGSWENGEAQFLATRGYATVQVNYRGSGGRGKAFEDSGKRQMGSGMMQDMLDGLKWAIDQGYTDPKRVCVYGASYGGYTAFFQPVYAPQGTFKCSVAIAGVSDIRVQNERSDTRRSKTGRSFLRQAWGMGDEEYIKANSAINHVDKFNVPVLIIHGEDDPRVPIQNAREMRDALEKAGKAVEYMTRPKEGHGFFKEENNVDRYKITEAFLAKYLGPGAPAAP